MAKREMVEAHVENLLKKITGIPNLLRDDDGDWGFGLKQSVMYVRVTGDTDPVVRVWGFAAKEVPEDDRAFRYVNEINKNIEFTRALLNEGVVFITAELVGESLDIEELDRAMDRVSAGVQFFGPKIVESIGGHLPRPAAEPEAQPEEEKSGMYL